MTPTTVRSSLVAALQQDLVGPMDPHEVLSLAPSRWYLTGFLVPDNGPRQADPLAGEDLAPGADVEEDDGTSDAGPRERPWLPASFGLSVLVDGRTRQLGVEVSWGHYERLDAEESRRLRRPDDEEEDDEDPDVVTATDGARVRRCWRRVGTHTVPATLRLDKPDDEIKLDDEGRWLRVQVRPATGHGLPPGARAVAVFLHNRADGRGATADEATLFQAALTLRCDRGFLPRTQAREGRHDDDRRDDLLYRDRAEYAVGHGISAAWDPGAPVTTVRTTWMPQAFVGRMVARPDGGLPLSMRALAALPSGEATRAALTPLLTAYDTWIDRLAAVDVGDRRDTAASLITEARACRARIAAGLDLLADDPTAFEAFCLMQRAMADAAARVRPGEEPRWRLFQLAFVLLNLPPAVHPDHPDRLRTELLFFPTGGGKTEAYLGIAAFTILHRRLTLGDRGAGVTVLLRYTLRLLTLDQLGRAATLVCALELLRAEHAARMGAERIRVGLWVGNKATPGTLKRMGEELRRAKQYGEPPPVPLSACPWCGAAFDVRTIVLEDHTMRLGCKDPDCAFHFDRSEGLPIAFVDEHVYRTLPAFLIATVDKFASLPWRAAAGMLLGRVRGHHPEHGWFGHGEEGPRGCQRVADLPPPALIIQDELHLISGPLGTMVGLYETALDALSGGRARVIASTATARRAREQVAALFGRPDVAFFPPPGLDPDDSFFATLDARADHSRQYIGVAAPGRSAKRVLTAVMTTLVGAAQAAWEQQPPSADHPADGFMTLATYFNSLRELGGARRIYQDEVLRRARRARRRAPLRPGVGPLTDRHVAWEPLELTSRQSVRDIAEAKDILARPFVQQGKRKADVLLASSMISVGVDISRLNLMLVHGQPRTTAEYIQATSRVGRAGPGLVITLHNLVKPRDRSHYERFQAWHGCFYRYVEAASVTPWSMRAVQRGLAGVVTGWLRHRDDRYVRPAGAEQAPSGTSEDEVLELLDARAARDPLARSFPVRAWLKKRIHHLLGAWKTAVRSTRSAGGSMVWSTWDPDTAGRKPLLTSAVDPIDPDREPELTALRAPTSMRDVEPGVHLWVDLPRDEAATERDDDEEPAP